MTQTRRLFLQTVAATGATMVLPFAARAEQHASDVFETAAGPITVHPVHHASMLLETPAGVIYVDPVGGADLYAGFASPGLILITHEHGDHYDADTLAAVMGEETRLVTNPAVHAMLAEDIVARAEALENGASSAFGGVTIDAIPAHNTTEGRMDFHPEGRDNGYVLGFEEFRVYVSGDTEPTPEMLALEDIDLAFLCMNLPFTQTAEQAAEAVRQFRPKVVYPYHYRGRDGGTQNPETFASLVGDAAEVRMGDWYEPGELEG